MDLRYYSINSVTTLVEKAGLGVEYVGYHNVFIQEFFTQLLKWISSMLGKEYEHQGDIHGFIDSRLFTIYRSVLLPIINILVQIEDFIFEKMF